MPEYQPNFLKRDPATGLVYYDFEGHVKAQGLELPAVRRVSTPEATPDALVKWVDRDNGSDVAGLYGKASAGPPALDSLHARAGDATSGVVDRKILAQDGTSDYLYDHRGIIRPGEGLYLAGQWDIPIDRNAIAYRIHIQGNMACNGNVNRSIHLIPNGDFSAVGNWIQHRTFYDGSSYLSDMSTPGSTGSPLAGPFHVAHTDWTPLSTDITIDGVVDVAVTGAWRRWIGTFSTMPDSTHWMLSRVMAFWADGSTPIDKLTLYLGGGWFDDQAAIVAEPLGLRT